MARYTHVSAIGGAGLKCVSILDPKSLCGLKLVRTRKRIRKPGAYWENDVANHESPWTIANVVLSLIKRYDTYIRWPSVVTIDESPQQSQENTDIDRLPPHFYHIRP